MLWVSNTSPPEGMTKWIYHGIMGDTMDNIVIDTSVFISALMSKRGAAYKLLSLVGTGQFDISLSVALVLEYEEIAKRLSNSKIMLSLYEIDDVIDYLCAVGKHHIVYYLWRPTLSDPSDDMVLELAVSAGCSYIVTHNVRHFQGVERFGIHAVGPKIYLEQIGALS
jgi:putative PIN family toxin of toxin-antitoxin system